MTWARVLTAVVLVPIVVGIVWWGSTALVGALTGLVTVLALLEFFALGEKIGMRGYRVWTCFCALAMLLWQWIATRGGFLAVGSQEAVRLGIPTLTASVEIVLIVFILGMAVCLLQTHRSLSETLHSLGISAAGLIFVALPLSYLVRLHGFEDQRPKLLLFPLVLVWVGDTAAYFVGRAFGRHLMAPQLSPKKTWEGAAANVVGSLAVGVAFARWMALPLPAMLGAAAAGSVAGQVGDLLESAYKRSAGVKDSGMLLPGHGGILDRIDALILAAPVVWYYWVFLLSGR